LVVRKVFVFFSPMFPDFQQAVDVQLCHVSVKQYSDFHDLAVCSSSAGKAENGLVVHTCERAHQSRAQVRASTVTGH
jgi:hypothetical protein